MQCIQDTSQLEGVFTSLEWDGLAPDSSFAGLPRVLGHRPRIAVGEEHRHCCGASGIELVAVQPDDPALSEQERRSLRDLAPGHAIAAIVICVGRSLARGMPSPFRSGISTIGTVTSTAVTTN